MASIFLTYFLFSMFINCIFSETRRVFVFIPQVKVDFDIKTHLDNPKVITFCTNRDAHCKSNNSNVCAFRSVNDTFTYKNFTNACYLFLSNMCDQPGEEYHIVEGGGCEDYLSLRRQSDIKTIQYITPDQRRSSNSTEIDIETENLNNSTEYNNTNDISNENKTNNVTEAPALRNDDTETEEEEEAYDDHICPKSCPSTYSPVCVNVNRGYGKYFKMFTFLNHCKADYYYCKHPKEFLPPPEESQEVLMVKSSPLSWSFCGASRYLQFARFAEVTSAMGHYGWLSGNYKYSHIMEPHERLPDHGK